MPVVIKKEIMKMYSAEFDEWMINFVIYVAMYTQLMNQIDLVDLIFDQVRALLLLIIGANK